MLLTIDIKESAVEQMMNFLKNLKDDVKIVSKKMIDNHEQLDIEFIDENDPDFKYILEAREARKNGDKIYSLDEVIKEFS